MYAIRAVHLRISFLTAMQKKTVRTAKDLQHKTKGGDEVEGEGKKAK